MCAVKNEKEKKNVYGKEKKKKWINVPFPMI
jgi:hypothetical protein